jgi:hypothetical protein
VIRLLIALVIALSMLAAPAFGAEALHGGPDGCAATLASGHDHHGAGTGDHEHAPAKSHASVTACCLAMCVGLPAVDGGERIDLPLSAAMPRPVGPALADHPTEPLEPPPRPTFLLTA